MRNRNGEALLLVGLVVGISANELPESTWRYIGLAAGLLAFTVGAVILARSG